MKKALLACLLGLLTFTTAFVVYESVAPANSEVSVSNDDYGGPFRRFLQRRKQQRQLRHQRRQKVEIITTADGQQYQRIIEVEDGE